MWYAMLGIFCLKSVCFFCFVGSLGGGNEVYLIITPAQFASEF